MRLALFVALVLSSGAFVLAAGEARAAEQLSQTPLQGKVEGTTIINGTKLAEPVPEATKPPTVPPPAEKPRAKDPAPPPPTNETPPAKERSPLPLRNESPPAEALSPPPMDPAPSTPEPEVAAPQPTPRPASRPAPQWFTAKTDGEVVESAPVLTTSQSMTDFSQLLEPKPMPNDSPDVTPGVIDPAPAPAAPAAAEDGYASGPAPDPVLLVPAPAAASEHALPAASGLAERVGGLVAEPAAARGASGHPPTPANAAPAAGLTPSAPVPTIPASVGGEFRLPSSLGTTAAGAVGTAVETARSAAANVATEVLESLTGGSPGTSSTDATNGTQEEPSEGTPQQPAPPLAPPAGGGSFSPSTGGGQLGTGWGSAPLLVGILALLAPSLLSRRDIRTYLISCEMPKPSSALLLPLERPG